MDDTALKLATSACSASMGLNDGLQEIAEYGGERQHPRGPSFELFTLAEGVLSGCAPYTSYAWLPPHAKALQNSKLVSIQSRTLGQDKHSLLVAFIALRMQPISKTDKPWHVCIGS